MTITTRQIRELQTEAARVGDYAMEDVCSIALGEELEEREPGIVPERIRSMSREDALAECERVIEADDEVAS